MSNSTSTTPIPLLPRNRAEAAPFAVIAVALAVLLASILLEGELSAATIMGTVVVIADGAGYSMRQAHLRKWWLLPAIVLSAVAILAMLAALELAGLNVDPKEVAEYWKVVPAVIASVVLFACSKYFR